MTKKEMIWSFLATGAVIIGVNILMDAGELEKKPPIQEQYPAVALSPYPTPITQYKADVEVKDQFKEAFIEGCTDGNQVSVEFCGCTYEYLLAEYGLIFFFENAEMTEPTTEMYEALAECSEYL